MAVIAVGHGPDDRVLIRLLGEQRQQFTDLYPRHIRLNRLVQRPAEVIPGGGLGVEGIQR